MRPNIILAVISILVFASACSGKDDEVTVYPVQCDTMMIDRRCPYGHARPLNPTTYKLFPDQHAVVGNVTGHMTRYTDCAIVDINNWTCSYNDKSGTFGFDGGYYSEVAHKQTSATKLLTEYMWYVSKQEHQRLTEEFVR